MPRAAEPLGAVATNHGLSPSFTSTHPAPDQHWRPHRSKQGTKVRPLQRGARPYTDQLPSKNRLLASRALAARVTRVPRAANCSRPLAHLAEEDARGAYRKWACDTLTTYCVYELRLSEDEAQRCCRAARVARQFPVLLAMLADASIHLTGILMLAPYLTKENHRDVLARARFRRKTELQRLVAELAPACDVPAVVEPLRPAQPRSLARAHGTWGWLVEGAMGGVRRRVPGDGPAEAPNAPDEWRESLVEQLATEGEAGLMSAPDTDDSALAPCPKLVLEQPAGDERTLPEGVVGTARFAERVGERLGGVDVDHRASRSVRSSASSSSVGATGRRGGLPRGRVGGRDQTAPNQLRQTRASIELAARPVRGGDSSATTRSRSVTSTVSPLAAKRT